VASTVMTNPEWRIKYRDRVNQLLPLFNPATKLQQRADEVAARIKPVITAMNEGAGKEFQNQVNWLKERLKGRAANLVQQNAVVEPRPLKFDANGVAVITKWETRTEATDATHEMRDVTGEPKTLSILCGPSKNCVASWRSKATLPPGKYRFEAEA